MKDYNKPFPIQGEYVYMNGKRNWVTSTIPWWLAEIAYEEYVCLYGNSQSLEQIAKRGGFGRDELTTLLRGHKDG